MENIDLLRSAFGERLQESIILAPYTSTRIGGPADFLIEVRSADELAETAAKLREIGTSFLLLGGGANILVSDSGVRGVVVLNRAKAVHFESGDQPFVRCESGAILSNVARRSAAMGFGGLEWAAAIPGTVGGAVYGNAGAFGGDMARDLIRAEVFDENGRSWQPVESMAYSYRSSILKRSTKNTIILTAEIRLTNSTPEEVQAKIEQVTTYRKASQPPGASLGSMFKNPPGDFAGRLIEAAGLKGTRIGNAEISKIHGNFFINIDNTKAADIKALIDLVKNTVSDKFGVSLELEVELIGEWK